MAEHLVSIFGTEKDRVNCPFYYKTGACRHGTRCSRNHNKPLFSPTILLENLYQSPDQIIASAQAQNLPLPHIPTEDRENHFEDFCCDISEEMTLYGDIDQLHVCENLADHLAGNTYVKFRSEEAAQSALNAVQGRWYAGRPVKAEFSPVTDFREGKCRPFERYGQCERGDFCHFMHLRKRPGAPFSEKEAEPETRSGGDDRYGYGARNRDSGRSKDYRRSYRGDFYDRERSRDYYTPHDSSDRSRGRRGGYP